MFHKSLSRLSRRIQTATVITTCAGLATVSGAAVPSIDGSSDQTFQQKVNTTLGVSDSSIIKFELHSEDGVTIAPLVSDDLVGIFYLTPYSVRAQGYQVLVPTDDGRMMEVEPGPIRTVRGKLIGHPDSVVAGSILDDGLHARIDLLDSKTTWWIEPLEGRVDGAEPGTYAIYEGKNVLNPNKTCGIESFPDAYLHSNARDEDGSAESNRTVVKVAQLACDADYEYYQDWGSVAGVEARINNVINTVNIQYDRDVGIEHVITTIIVRTSATQPYTSTDAVTLLNQFRNQWNANHGNITRDVAQLFTGKEVDGGTIGIAWVGVVCNLSYAYGLVQSDFNNNYASATDLSAHELGHNWNANHCNCTSNTMNPYITSANIFHSTFSIPEITQFRNSRSCLDDPFPPDTGACCVSFTCTIETEDDCTTLGGTWLGSGTDCSGTPCGTGQDVVNLATTDYTTTSGSITSGSYLNTQTQDDGYEALTERHSGGRPANRRSLLDHTWTVNVASGTAYIFYLDAYHDANSEDDDFEFSYSLDNNNFTTMTTVVATSDSDTYLQYIFTENIAGTVYVRVQDTDRTQGNRITDTLYVDHMYILTAGGGGDVTPPATPASLVATPGDATVGLDWDDNTDSDLDGYYVYRRTSATGYGTPLNGSPLGASTYTDNSVSNGTTYFYVVTAVDLTGNESGVSNEDSATPFSGTATMFVDSIVLSTERDSGPYRFGVATITVIDSFGNPVQGVDVTATFSGDFSEQVTATTDSSGVAILTTTSSVKRPSFSVCIDDVTGGALAYDADSNVETCDSF